MGFELTVLGSNSASPTSERYPSAQVLNAFERFFLFDCGEGTQMQLRRFKINFSKINHIFISHLHGDHCFGLPGLISSFGLLGRSADLYIYAHQELESLLKPWLDFFAHELPFKVVFVWLKVGVSEVIFEDKKVTVSTIPLRHRIPSSGFLVKEKESEPNINKFLVEKYSISIKDIVLIKQGADLTLPDGEVIPNEKLVIPPSKPMSFAYCTDTVYTPSIVPLLDGVDMLYHESTFMEKEREIAKKTMHSTAKQAAQIALASNAKQLIIGHFSGRYHNTQLMLDEAKTVFENSYLAYDGAKFTMKK